MLDYIKNMTQRYPSLSSVEGEVRRAVDMLEQCYRNGGKILLCGNGGSAADCEHIAGELLKGFLSMRRPCEGELEKLTSELGAEKAEILQRGIPAIPLVSFSGAISAFANDVSAELVYSQLVYALGRPSDVLIGLSTSGNSKNVVLAFKTARAMGLSTIALTGEAGGALSDLADVAIKVPERETYKVQELHLPVYHAICAELEARLFG